MIMRACGVLLLALSGILAVASAPIKLPLIGRRGNARATANKQPEKPPTQAAAVDPRQTSAMSRREKDLRTAFVVTTLLGSWALLKSKPVGRVLSNLKPLHPFFPFAPHQVLIFAAWALNMVAVRVPGRSDGTSWRDTFSVRFITPSGWAFAIWAPIFMLEMLMVFYQLLPINNELKGYMAKLSPGFAFAFIAQSLWCFTFRPWAFNRQYLSSALLASTALGLCEVHGVLREAARAGVMKAWEFILVHLPISLHFGWITAATLVNLNGWFALAPLRLGDKLGLALTSVNLAVTVGSQLTLSRGDPVYSLVLAWALAAVADDLKPGKSKLRKTGAVSVEALDCLETTAQFGAVLQGALALAVTLWKAGVAAGVVKEGDALKMLYATKAKIQAYL